jgi:hypothetical protein
VSRRGRRRALGQALILGLTLLIVCGLGLFYAFSTGQAAIGRARLVNATDAAAYSAGLVRARAMNWYAYANRAIVANEVAIAQAATMVSYARFLERLTDNAEDVGRYFPYVAQIAAALEEVAHYASELTRFTADVEVPVRSGHVAALAMSQEAMLVATNAFTLSQVATEVARANDRRFFAHALPADVSGAAVDLTRRYEGTDRRRLKDLIVASLDPFSTDRDHDLEVPGLPCGPKLARRGATEMIRDHDTDSFDRWQAYDTLSLHLPRLLSCSTREALPLGWGAAEVAREPRGELDPLSGAGAGLAIGDSPAAISNAEASRSKRTNPRAYDEASEELWVGNGYRGLPATRELDYRGSQALKDNPRFPVTRLAIVGRSNGLGPIGTAQAAGHGRDRVQPIDRFARGRMTTVATAEIYFRRPPQPLERIEYASLYSPYWQVRLVETPPAWRLVAAEAYQ